MKFNFGIDKDVITLPLNLTFYFNEGYDILFRISLAFLCFYVDLLILSPQEETVC